MGDKSNEDWEFVICKSKKKVKFNSDDDNRLIGANDCPSTVHQISAKFYLLSLHQTLILQFLKCLDILFNSWEPGNCGYMGVRMFSFRQPEGQMQQGAVFE